MPNSDDKNGFTLAAYRYLIEAPDARVKYCLESQMIDRSRPGLPSRWVFVYRVYWRDINLGICRFFICSFRESASPDLRLTRC